MQLCICSAAFFLVIRGVVSDLLGEHTNKNRLASRMVHLSTGDTWPMPNWTVLKPAWDVLALGDSFFSRGESPPDKWNGPRVYRLQSAHASSFTHCDLSE